MREAVIVLSLVINVGFFALCFAMANDLKLKSFKIRHLEREVLKYHTICLENDWMGAGALFPKTIDTHQKPVMKADVSEWPAAEYANEGTPPIIRVHTEWDPIAKTEAWRTAIEKLQESEK